MNDQGHFFVGRQANKDEKLARIAAAAASLFVERGFEATTTSAVAERAGVAKGTLFLYASTKGDLVAHVFSDRLGPAVERAWRTLPEGGSIVDEACHLFGTFFALYAPTPELARIFIRELLFPAAAVRKLRDDMDHGFVEKLAARIERRMQAGELAPAPPMLVAGTWFSLYLVQLIAWLGGAHSSAAVAQRVLRATLELSVRGLLPIAHARKENDSCPPPPSKRATSTRRSARSARTEKPTSKRTTSATAATKRSGSR